MRIRSTKPEFWRSERIASVDWDARLVLKGLESYVDDNGVGKDDLALVVSDLFSRDLVREPSRTLARVLEALSTLESAGLVHRYEHDGTRLLYLSWWESFQRVDKATRGRFPRPDGTFNYGDSTIGASFASSREDSRALVPGTGEQGNRGTGDQGTEEQISDRSLALIDPIEVDPQPTLEELFADWWTHVRRKVSKPAAERAFAAAVQSISSDRREAAAVLTAAIDEHQRHWFVLAGRSIDKTPHPATWLNSRSWTDELPTDDAYQARPTAASAETPTQRIQRLRTAALHNLEGDHHGNAPRLSRPALDARAR